MTRIGNILLMIAVIAIVSLSCGAALNWSVCRTVQSMIVAGTKAPYQRLDNEQEAPTQWSFTTDSSTKWKLQPVVGYRQFQPAYNPMYSGAVRFTGVK